jgi:transposase
MQKALTEINVQLHRVVSDITGVTGMAIIRAILAGERDPQRLALLKDPRAKRSTEEIAAALVLGGINKPSIKIVKSFCSFNVLFKNGW